MKSRVLILILFMTFACNDDDSQVASDEQITNGDYIGVFERNGVTSNVELNFNNGEFTGSSETEKFPAICSGEYSISDNQILFENECIWTAEFDWTLILSESWSYTFQDNVLIMIKSNGDKYTLTQQ